MNYNDSPDIAKTITKLKSFDGLDQAEKITGEDYKTNEDTDLLGLVLTMENAKALDALLDLSDDTKLTNSYENYVRIISEEGFERVFSIPFKCREHQEKFEIWWHPDGLLLCFDTYTWGDKEGEPSINSANVYYNWQPNDAANCYKYTSSGRMTGYERYEDSEGNIEWKIGSSGLVWSGNHDARQALRLTLHALRSNGTFLPVWREQPHLWLCHYMDSDKSNKPENWSEARNYYDEIKSDRVSSLPENVQLAIKGQ